MTITNKRSLIALLMSLVLVISLFTIGISADGTTGTEAKGTETEVTTSADDTSTDTSKESGSNKETSTNKETSKNEEAPKKEETTAGLSADAKNARKTLLINGIIIAAIVLVLVLVAIKFRKKLGDFLRSVKSELKKIVWTSKENTRKSFLVVVVVAVLIALVLFVVDFAFKSGLGMIYDLVK